MSNTDTYDFNELNLMAIQCLEIIGDNNPSQSDINVMEATLNRLLVKCKKLLKPRIDKNF